MAPSSGRAAFGAAALQQPREPPSRCAGEDLPGTRSWL